MEDADTAFVDPTGKNVDGIVHAGDNEDFLVLLAQEQQGIEDARARMAAIVFQVRAEGVTWAKIAEALSISPQSAYQRYSPGANARHSEAFRRRNTRSSNEQGDPTSSVDTDET